MKVGDLRGYSKGGWCVVWPVISVILAFFTFLCLDAESNG